MNLISEHTSPAKEYKFPYSDKLTDDQISQIRENSNIVSYKKKDIIFRQQTRTSHIMIITKGMVKIYKEGSKGKVSILKIGTKNNFLGLMSVFGDDIHQYSAAAIDDTNILYIDINVFINTILNNGAFALELCKTISSDGLYIFEKMVNQSQKHLPGRIADVLLYFSEEVFKNPSFILPFTRKELAEFSGTTKESFIRTLSEFKHDKIIELNGSHIEIKSYAIVKTLSALG